MKSHLAHFVRNLPLERDIALALARRDAFSFGGFLDLLDEQIQAYNHPQAEQYSQRYYTRDNLGRTLRTLHRKLPLVQNRDLNASERKYIDDLREYLSGLEPQLQYLPHPQRNILQEFSTLVFNCQTAEQLLEKLEADLWLKNQFAAYIPQSGNLIFILRNPQTRFVVLFHSRSFNLNSSEDHCHLYIPDPAINDEIISSLVADHCVKSLWVQGDNRLRHYGLVCWPIQRLIAEYEAVVTAQSSPTELASVPEVFSKIKTRLEALDHYLTDAPLRMNGLDRKKCVDYIQLIRNNLVELHNCHHWRYSPKPERRLNQLRNSIRIELDLLLNQIDIALSLDQAVRFSLAQIKSSNTLYLMLNGQSKSVDLAFGEQNLAGVVAAILRGIYLGQPHIAVNSEVQLGQGRTDITLKSGNIISGHIEFKLVRPGVNIAEKTRDALHQLFARYSENDGLDNRYHLSLYIVIFAHDKNFAAFADKIYEGVGQYAQNQKLEYQPVASCSSENSFTFLLTAKQSHFGMTDKTRMITVIVCNLEIEYQKRAASVLNRANFPREK